MNDTQLQSETISYLRFPLIVAVILIHSSISSGTINWLMGTYGEFGHSTYDSVSFLISDVIARMAVPVFFLSSGFLFFYNTKEWNCETYGYKVKRRIKSLFLPYLFWCGLTLLIYFLVQSTSLGAAMFSVKDLPIRDYGVTDFLNAFWATPKEGVPLLYPFWFIRDLIVVCLLSPFVWWAVRYLKGVGVLALGCCWFFDLFGMPGFSTVAFFFFSLGAYFSIHRINMVATIQKLTYWPLLLYPILAIADLITMKYPFHAYLHNLGILLGIACMINLVSSGLKNNRIHTSAFLSNASFFVFSIHEPALKFIKKLLIYLIEPQHEISLFVIYLLPMIVIVGLALSIYYLMLRLFPGFLRFVSGGR